MELHLYESELKHNLDRMIVPQIPNSSVQSGQSGATDHYLNKYAKMMEEVGLPDQDHLGSVDQEPMQPAHQSQSVAEDV